MPQPEEQRRACIFRRHQRKVSNRKAERATRLQILVRCASPGCIKFDKDTSHTQRRAHFHVHTNSCRHGHQQRHLGMKAHRQDGEGKAQAQAA